MPRAASKFESPPRCKSVRARYAALYTHRTSRLPAEVRQIKPEPPHQLSSPAERFVTALLDGETFGLEQTESDNIHDNIALTLIVEKAPGSIKGAHQDLPTYNLLLVVEPGLVMRTLRLTIDSCRGKEYLRKAPAWVQPLISLEAMRARRARTYDWVFKCLQVVLYTPGQVVLPAMEEWRQLLQYTVHIKDLQDAAKRPRRTNVPRPRPRPLRTVYGLQQALEGLHIGSSDGGERDEAGVGALDSGVLQDNSV
ncbi:hypothetical protein FKP32DRAFT_1671950 [Trametes sanguinea]|nr:hypothetical protein FKP32DRAFT_1671950 [Trametes sanguinea]